MRLIYRNVDRVRSAR